MPNWETLVFSVHMEKAYSKWTTQKPSSITLISDSAYQSLNTLVLCMCRITVQISCRMWDLAALRTLSNEKKCISLQNSSIVPSDKGLNPAWLGYFDLKCRNALEGKPPTQVCLRAITPRPNQCTSEFAPCSWRERGLLLFTAEPLVLVVWPQNPLVSHVWELRACVCMPALSAGGWGVLGQICSLCKSKKRLLTLIISIKPCGVAQRARQEVWHVCVGVCISAWS